MTYRLCSSMVVSKRGTLIRSSMDQVRMVVGVGDSSRIFTSEIPKEKDQIYIIR